MIPIGDTPKARATPWACYGLMLANILCWVSVGLPASQQSVSLNDPWVSAYLAAVRDATGANPWSIISDVSAYDLIVFRWGFRPAAPSLVTLLTSLFMHAGWFHLFVNVLFLYVFGPHVEARFGQRRFVAVYLGCGVAATLTYASFKWGSPLPLIGASGAISGILGCYYVWFSHHRIRILTVIFIFITTFELPAGFVLAFYLIVENLLPLVLDPNATGGVAYGAHFGGFVAGALIARSGLLSDGARPLDQGPSWWQHNPLAELIRQRAFARAEGRSSQPEVFSQRLRQQRFDEARAIFNQLSSAEQEALPAADIFILADHLTQQKDFAAALRILEQALATQPARSADVLARLHIRAGFIRWRGQQMREHARQHFMAALTLQPTGPAADAARSALASLQL